MLNFGASKPRVRGGPGPPGPPLDPHLFFTCRLGKYLCELILDIDDYGTRAAFCVEFV